MDVLKWIAQLFEEYGYGVLFSACCWNLLLYLFPGKPRWLMRDISPIRVRWILESWCFWPF